MLLKVMSQTRHGRRVGQEQESGRSVSVSNVREPCHACLGETGSMNWDGVMAQSVF